MALENGYSLDSVIDTVRLFLDCFDFSDASCAGWDALIEVAYAIGAVEGYEELNMSLFEWIVRYFQHDIKENYETLLFSLIFGRVYERVGTEFLSFLLELVPKKTIDGDQWSAPLAFLVNFHHLILDFEDKSDTVLSQSKSFTSRSTFSSRLFWLWRYLIHEAGVNTKVVLDKELKQGFWAQDGWSRETLQTLFDWEFEYHDRPRHESYCDDCGAIYHWIGNGAVQPLWRSSLDQIKRGVDPEKTMWALCTSEKNTSRELNSINAPSLAIDDNSRAASSTNIATATEVGSQDSRSDSHMPAFPYGRDDTICRNCWFDFCKTGIRRRRQQSHDLETSSSDGGLDVDTSDDDFSPFHIHS